MHLKKSFLFLFLLSTLVAFAQEGCDETAGESCKYEGLSYLIYPDTHEAVVDNGRTWIGELNIPSEIEHNGERYTVTGITNNAFLDSSELTKVRIPKTIDHIVHGALSDDPNITGEISSDAMNPFHRCIALESIEVDENSPIMSSENGILYSKDKTQLYCYPAGKQQEEYAIPENVTWIGCVAISNNHYLSSLTIPNSVTYCGSICDNCINLEHVKLSENITYIPAYSFDKCESLKFIELPSGVTYMGESAFRSCSSLESVVLPPNITFIGSCAFMDCTNLKTIELPTSLDYIEYGMFIGCANLNMIAIPDGVTSIGSSAFDGCSSLKELDIPSSVTNIGCAFSGCKFNHLIIRGRLRYLNWYTFNGMDTSTTIYTLTSQVEDLKKIYEGEVLPLEAYTNDFEQVKLRQSSSIIFDLQGRHLSDKPSKGIYIQNGKKVVIK